MRGGYRSRHSKPSGSSPPSSKYSVQAWQEYSQTPLRHDEQDDGRLKSLQEHGPKNWSQQDAALYDELSQRKEEREDMHRVPLRKELEGYFDGLNLSALPPPLAKSSFWLETKGPCNYDNEDVRPFYAACEEGELEEVKRWLENKKDMLLQIGLQDGLACAAKGNKVDVASYLLSEGHATLHGAVIKAACTNLSLPLFEICLQHGYHPNQQIPSLNGHFGTALVHCIDNEDIVRLLLQHGADPNIAPFHDNRKSNWGLRATPPMDRTSGLALDLAVKNGNVAVIELLLDHGADPRYSRPLHGLITLHHDRRDPSSPAADEQWRPLMEKLIRCGADVNATTYGGGTPLHKAVAGKSWDIVEFLLEQGADPRILKPATKLDVFAAAAKDAGTPWGEGDDVEGLLAWLYGSDTDSGTEDTSPGSDGAKKNPLVRIVAKMRGKTIAED